MGYTMDTHGSVVLPSEVEAKAFEAAGTAMASVQGWYPAEGDVEVATLGDLAQFVGAALTREGDRVRFGTDEQGDPKWSDQATAFYLALAPYVSSGEVRFVGEDGTEWQYRYERGSVRQAGINGWDGSSAPFGPPADLSTDLPPEPEARPAAGPGARPRTSGIPSPPLGLSPTVLSLLIGLAVLVVLLLAL